MSNNIVSDVPSAPQDDAEESAPKAAPVSGDTDHRAGTGTATAETEIGGPEGPEPTRYGDWEKKGRCIDF